MNILNKLTLKHLKLNIKRTVVTIIGIMLSTALMLTMGTMFSSILESLKADTIKRTGDFHVQYRHIDPDKVDSLIHDVDVDNTYMSRLLGVSELYDDVRSYTVSEANSDFFNNVVLAEGVLPKNNKEVLVDASYLAHNKDLKIGDKVTLSYGDASIVIDDFKHEFKYKNLMFDEILLDRLLQYPDLTKVDANKLYDFNESDLDIENIVDVEYTIVGSALNQNGYWMYNYQDSMYTLNEDLSPDNLVINVKYDNPKDVDKLVNLTIENYLDEDFKEIANYKDNEYYYNYRSSVVNENYELLVFTNGTGWGNIDTLLTSLLMIVLSIVAMGCIVVIYNSFAISAIDRKREFGHYSSLGATPNQIRFSVYYEALIVGSIGILLGVILSMVVSQGLIQLVSHYTYNLFSIESTSFAFEMHISLKLFIIPIIFMIFVIYFSAMIPARRSSKTTAIDLIGQVDDVKISPREVKSNFLVSKVFKAEGVLAHKNMKRNKRRYRTTLIALVASVVIFISFSTFTTLLEKAVTFAPVDDYDVELRELYDSEKQGFEAFDASNSLLKELKYIDLMRVYSAPTDDKSQFTDEFIEKHYSGKEEMQYTPSIYFYAIKDDEFVEYKNSINAPDNAKNIVINNMKSIRDGLNGKDISEYKIYDETIDALPMFRDEEASNPENRVMELKDLYFTDREKVKDFNLNTNSSIVVITDLSSMSKLQAEYAADVEPGEYTSNVFNYTDTMRYIITDDSKTLVSELDKLDSPDFFTSSPTLEKQVIKDMVTLSRIIVYMFVAVTTLIGITSVFNTVYTSIILRRREFAMLRSVGLDTQGFNRILVFESLIFSIKTLLIALPISGMIVYFINRVISYDVFTLSEMIIPTTAIIISILSVFLIMISVSMYSAKNIKKDNILESLRKELN